MSECEIVRGLRVELEDAKRLLDREIKANNYTETEARSLIESYRMERDEAIRERDALREEIARRDAEKPVTALSWIEKTDARLEKVEDCIADINRRGLNGAAFAEKTISRLGKIEARQDGTDAWKEGCADGWKELEKRFAALTTAISNRLDGPTGIVEKIVSLQAKFERSLEILVERMNADSKHYRDGLAKLEARVSKKRVKK
jgi:hypothetical protein